MDDKQVGIEQITIGTLGDWLKNHVPVFQPMKGKTKNQLHVERYT